MRRRPTFRTTTFAAAGLLTAFAVAACGGSSSTSGTQGGGGNTSYGAALNAVVNSSTHSGGTLTFAMSSTPDSFDPGNAYYAWVWNINRLWATPLVTYRSSPGPSGKDLVPGLAQTLGTQSADGLTWTYHLKHGVTFEDGTPVTSADIKYAVERTFDRSVLNNGPSYYMVLLGGNAASYPGPYKDRAKNMMGLTAISTPDPYTVVFHLAHPFPDFNYVVAISQSAPVPPDKDTGTNYQNHPLSTGPYMFSSYQLNKQAVLVRNPQWKQFYDTEARQLPSKIVIDLNVNAADIDNRLLAGDIDVDAAGTGVQAAARAKILSSPSLMTHADNALTGFLWFAYLNTKVAPLNNIHCRRAIEYAADKTDQQTAYGGPVAGGAIASTVDPPTIIGYKSFDMYEALTKPSGDDVKAKAELTACGQPNGFSTGIAYRSDRPKEVQAAQSLQAALGKVGINLSLHGFTGGTYYQNFAGVPNYVHQHGLGIDMGGWGADWPDGYGFLDEISNGNAIVSTGNTNIEELNDPIVNNAFSQAASPTLSVAQRTAIWSQIDKEIMTQAGILPEVYSKALLYRNPDVTNVYVHQYYGMYNYAVLGVK